MDRDVSVWSRREGEPTNWYKRFDVFLQMGSSRTMLGAVHLVEKAEKSGKRQSFKTPGSWNRVADKWQWQKRADAYDAYLLAEREAKEERLRQLEEEEEARLLSTGYARKARRVEQLTILYNDLKDSYHEVEEKERIVYQWLTPDKVREMRGCLDDIAKELGERVKKAEITGKDGGPMEFICEWGSGAIESNDQDES